MPLVKIFFLILLTIVFQPETNIEQSNSVELSRDEKEKRCRQVFNKLKRARGLLPESLPTLHMRKNLPNRHFSLAMADNEKGEIYIQEKAYDLCFLRMGADSLNALAFLLSHELSHFTRQHSVRHRFIEKFQEGGDVDSSIVDIFTQSGGAMSTPSYDSLLQTYREVSLKYQIREHEAEADLDAGFTSYLAGFRSETAGANFLAQAYDVFNISDGGGTYASLEERQEIARNTGLRLDTMIHIYELGNLLAASRDYLGASECYDYVSRIYESKEILNNQGFLRLKEVTQTLGKKDLPYVLPLTLEIQDGGGKNVDGFAAELQEEYDLLLRLTDEAMDFFNKAIFMDPEYSVCYLNKSAGHLIRHALKNKYYKVSSYAEDELSFALSAALHGKQNAELDTLRAHVPFLNRKKIRSKQVLSNILVQMALITHASKQDSLAFKYLNEAKAINPKNNAAAANEEIFTGSEELVLSFSGSGVSFSTCDETEQVRGQYYVGEILENSEFPIDFQFNVLTEKVSRYTKELTFVMAKLEDDFDCFAKVKKRHNKTVSQTSFVKFKDNYDLQTGCHVRKGSHLDDVKLEYGTKPYETETPYGTYLSYEKEGIESGGFILFDGVLFLISPDRTVKHFAFYERMIPAP